jgi:flotillin
MAMIRLITILLLLFLFVIILIAVIGLKYYVKCPAGSILIVFNNKSDAFGNTIKIIKSGGAYIWPFGGSYVIFDLSPFSIQLDLAKLHDKDGISLHLNAKILLAISSFENEVQNAIERISGLNKAQISELSTDLMASHTRTFFSSIQVEETKNREKITSTLVEALKVPIEDIGLKIINLDIIEIRQI